MHKRIHTSAFKAQIVLSIIKKESTIAELAAKHNLVPSLIHKWHDAFMAKVPAIFDTPEEEVRDKKRITQLEHVVGKLTTQNDFLEKVLAVTK